MAEVSFAGVGTPVTRPERSVSGSEFRTISGASTFTNANSPTTVEVDGPLPVTVSNRPGFYAAPSFDNKGIIVDAVVPQAQAPIGGRETVFFTPPVRYGER